jgi:Na+-transporting methylmalonyl-CoA/oxaloacetate decarboxylase gamma subunit
MRMVFSVLSLLIVVAIVGVLAKKQLSSVPAPATAATSQSGVVAPTGTPKQQVDQFKQAVELQMQQQPRTNADEAK